MDERELERRARVAQLLLRAARTLGETLEPDRVYDRFHDLLAEFVLHDGLLVSSYDEAEKLIRCEYAWSDGNRLDTSVFPPLALNRGGGGMQSRVIVQGEPLLFNDVAEVVRDPGGTYYDVDREGNVRKLPDSGPPGSAAAMMVPVKHQARDLWLSFVAVRGEGGTVYAFRDLTSERRLDEEKSDLISTISHELRTPMAAVYGAAQTLLRRESELTPEQKRQMLEMVVEQAARLSHITEAVLLATQLDRGTLSVETEPVDLGELARSTV